jgi:hypothetical protein
MVNAKAVTTSIASGSSLLSARGYNNTGAKWIVWLLGVVFIGASIPEAAVGYTVSVCIPKHGTVSPSPGAHTYASGSTISIKATPAAGCKFVRWDASGGVTLAKAILASTTMTVNANGTLCPQFEGPVTFNDATLKAAVEAALGKTNPNHTDMLALTYFEAFSKGITDLTGLEYAYNLYYLGLDHNQVRDLSPLAGLMKLQELHLEDNQITDFSALVGLTKLESLYLSYNQIREIPPLAGLGSDALLPQLLLGHNQITDISGMAGGRRGWYCLGLDNNQIRDISPLAGLGGMDWRLQDNQISDISPLVGSAAGKGYLDLRRNPLHPDACRIYIPQMHEMEWMLQVDYDACWVLVPDVVRMSESEAGSAITAGGLTVGTKTSQCSNSVVVGRVASQSPTEGTLAAPGSAVNLTISSGPCPASVPNVVGMTRSQAESAITSAGLVVGTTGWAHSDTVPEGQVIEQSPAAGTMADPGSEVELTISQGPGGSETIAVPNVVGMSQSQAQSAITSAGLAVGTITQSQSQTVPQGQVISQNPAGGTQAPAGAAVNLTVSTGSTPAGPIPGGPVAHWKLDETQGTTAFDSTGAHNGTLNGNPTWQPTGGMIGGALSFDAVDDRVNCGSFNPSAATGKLSICLWAKWNGQPTNWQGLIAKRNGWGEGTTMWSLEAAMNTGKLGFFHYTSARFGGDPVLPIGEWTHVAVGFDGTTATMYIDGEPTGSGPFSLPSDTQLPVVVGASIPDGGSAFNGALDDIRLYDQGLCQRQVLAVMGGSDIVLPTENKDIGVGKAGSDSYKSGVYTVQANGSNIEASRDDFRYVYVAVTGDFEISARVLSLQKTNAWSKAGVMVRETLDAGDRNAFMCVTPETGEGRFVFQARSGQAGGPSNSLQTTQGQVSFPDNTWLKITRKGKALTGLISQDGLSWQKLPGPYPVEPGGSSNPVTIEMPQTVYVGLAVTANDARGLCKAEFDNVLISLNAGAAEESQGPVAYWTFDETTGRVAADSAGECDGVLMGGPVWQPTGGKVAGALKFDGSNDVVVTDFVVNPADGPFSVFAWVNGGGGGQVIVSQDGSAGGTDWLGASSAGRLTSALCSPALTSSKVITDDQWHEVGLTWDGTSRTLYVDGAAVAMDKPTAPASSTGGLNIGAGKNLDAGTFWSGLIDDVRIYNKAVKP